MLRYSGPGSTAGVALALQAMELAFPSSTPTGRSSADRHATKHDRAVGHPLIQSYEPGEDWWWCFIDEVAFLGPGAPSSAHQ